MINITKGMADGAESIHANFQEVKISAGENANGSWFTLGEFAKVARGKIVFTKTSDFIVGDTRTFNIELPIEMSDYNIFLETYAYNGSGAFDRYTIEKHMVNQWAGSMVVIDIDSGVREITIQFLAVGV